MGPNATLRRLLDAARENDRDEYIAACEDLAAWLASGGVPPTVPVGTKYIPGTGTDWGLFPPYPPNSIHQPTVWTLRHYDPSGNRIGTWALEDRTMTVTLDSEPRDIIAADTCQR